MRANSSGRRRTSGGSSASQAGGGGAATQSTTSSLSARKEPTAHSAALRPPSGSTFPARRLRSTRVLQREVASYRARKPPESTRPRCQLWRFVGHPRWCFSQVHRRPFDQERRVRVLGCYVHSCRPTVTNRSPVMPVGE